MSKNIVIFSDGTGQAGGLIPDEARTNVYKLFRAARCGTDTKVDPSKQLAFYDPGLGSKLDGGGLKIGWWRWIYNILSQATGLGLTQNIVDCYSAIIRMYEPGDRIFLFGFSRGAYTVRCLGGVMALCGIPTSGADGQPLLRDDNSARLIAGEAVRDVYQHGSGTESPRFAEQRKELAKNFRDRYQSGADGAANVLPYFIGVWDTVAAVGASWFRLAGLAIGISLLSWGLLWTVASFLKFLFPDWVGIPSFWTIMGIAVAVVLIYLLNMLKWTSKVSDPWWKTVHFTQWRLRFYDRSLNPGVKFAKHALSIDENRKDFDRVEWSDHGDRPNDDAWFEQVWFAGNHSDVGGSYPENESRLSDVALKWMVGKAASLPHPLIYDKHLLHLYPSAGGPQHDERKSSTFPWTEGLRKVPPDAPLHPTVIARLKLERVFVYDRMIPYRPEPLRNHDKAKKYY